MQQATDAQLSVMQTLCSAFAFTFSNNLTAETKYRKHFIKQVNNSSSIVRLSNEANKQVNDNVSFMGNSIVKRKALIYFAIEKRLFQLLKTKSKTKRQETRKIILLQEIC